MVPEISVMSLTPQAEGSAATEFGSLMGKVQGIVWDLSHAQAVVECAWDPTLHLGSLGKAKSGGGAGARWFPEHATNS